jgi:Protein of unknown function (DUF2786)
MSLAREFWDAAADRHTTGRRFAGRPPATVDAAAGLVLERALANTWPHGWLPYDLVQVVSRELDDAAVSLLVDGIAAENSRYAPSTVHPRWQQQLTEIGASLWWDQSRPHLSQWAARHDQNRQAALDQVLWVLRVLMSLTKLPVILPLPGTVRSAVSTRSGVDHKVLARVRALLAKAESTQFPDEADALSAKAQELMHRHAFDRALLDVSDHVPQSAVSRRLWLENPYVRAKFQLVNAIADANRSRAVFYPRPGFVALVGDELDLEITELLSTSLLVQATKAMVATKSRSRSFRHAFLIAYATRIGERLRTAHEEALLPILANRKQVVDNLFDTLFKEAVTKSVSVSNAAGWGAGRAAADHANLTIDRTAVPGR